MVRIQFQRRFSSRRIAVDSAWGSGPCVKDGFNGFTLIEILMTLVVIGLLVALLLPLLENARSSARTATGLSNQRQIAIGIGAYMINFDETLPLGFTDLGGDYSNWASSVSTYLGSNSQTSFPDFLSLISTPLNDVFLDPNVGHEQSPDAPTFKRNLDYSGHLHLLGNTSSGVTPPYQMYQVRRASETLLVTDGAQYVKPPPVPALYVYPTADKIDVGTNPLYDPSATDNDDTIDPGLNIDSDDLIVLGYIRWRQYSDTAANILFVDGHAATVKMDHMKYRNVRVDPR